VRPGLAEDSRTGGITFDDRLWPLVIVQCTGLVTAEQYEACLAGQTNRLERGPCFFLFDTSCAGPSLAEFRRRHMAWMTSHDALLRQSMLGAAFVITSPIIRLAASILQHVKPMPFPQIFVSQEAQARQWLARRLTETGHLAQAESLSALGPR